ncbi:rhamnogalacturonan acetylesterase [uncultured Duncaniella sp.]|uniref:rhamnogalacturonan acetylesterase n=1 Tax=uncultured Duncaniella sp. TaxID=2768039 RepID=UPI002676F117|nr:rhamnogalacturonan acetylesterase [uncultured Duncaniella sp.]
MKFLATLLAASVPMMAMAMPEPTDTVTVFMIGDSTMANKPLAKENQERGWGQMLPIYLQGKIKVDNHAVNGRSSKSFMDEGRWDKVMEKLRPGDFVIIQFGHNDEKEKSPDRYTVPGGSFDDNLRRYVNDAKSKGATPILMNSIARRNFPPNAGLDIASESDDKQKDWKGKYPNEGVILVDTHGAYLDSPRNVAAETGVTFIDMNKLTHKLVQELGPSASRDLFMWIPADTYEFCPKGKIDNTHLNVLGGIMVSRLAVNALAAQVPELREYIRPEVYNLK